MPTRFLGIKSFLFLLLLFAPSALTAQTYDIYIGHKMVNFTGKEVKALAINESIPGPTLTFTEGDTAIVHVHNELDVETSVHWHGLLLPNAQDGVPYLTTYPIEAGTSHTFTIPLIQAGTYWYHSHSGLQEQRGVYGSLVIHPKTETIEVDAEQVLVFSDWTNEKPSEVMRSLKRASEWYTIKKDASQSWDRVVKNGAVVQRLRQSFQRMPPMDISDVYYDAFLTNGVQEQELPSFEPGDKVRLRIINAAASTYLHLQFAGGPMTIVASDGLNVNPVDVDRMMIAVAETYDVVITIPEDGAYEFRASAQDGSGYTSAYFGRGERRQAPTIPAPDLFMMDHMNMDMDMEGDHSMHEGMSNPEEKDTSSEDDHSMMGHSMPKDSSSTMSEKCISNPPKSMHEMMGHSAPKMAPTGDGSDQMKDEKVFDYKMLCSPHSTELPGSNPERHIRFELTGNMDRYVWSFDNKILSEVDKILIKKGENVKFTLVNRTMMHHPMHLHGHYFRVLNGNGEWSPLKHTVDVPPMETVVIEFEANEEKDWFFHCHILYHMMSGMARILSYEGSVVDPVLAEYRKNSPENMNPFYFWGDLSVLSQTHMGEFLASNTRNGFGLMWEGDWTGEYEVEADYRRYLTRFLSVFAGGDFRKEQALGVIGVRYILPLYIESEFRVDQEGGLRARFGSGIDLLPRLHLGWSVDTDEELEFELDYTISKRISLLSTYHSEYRAGLGLTLRL